MQGAPLQRDETVSRFDIEAVSDARRRLKYLKLLKLWQRGKRERLGGSLRFWARDLRTRGLRPSLPSVDGEWPTCQDAPLVFAVADPIFLERHAAGLAGSLALTNPDAALHIHLYDPGEAEHALVDDLRKVLDLRLTTTWEIVPDFVRSETHRVIYYQSMRFVRLAELVDRFGGGVLAVDIDSLIRAELSHPLHLPAVDVSLRLRPLAGYAGGHVLASAVWVRPTAVGRRLLADAAERIARHLLSGVPVEKLDQRSLWLAWLRHRRAIDLWPLPAEMADHEMSVESVIWHGKGDRDREEAFRAAQLEASPLTARSAAAAS